MGKDMREIKRLTETQIPSAGKGGTTSLQKDKKLQKKGKAKKNEVAEKNGSGH